MTNNLMHIILGVSIIALGVAVVLLSKSISTLIQIVKLLRRLQ